MIRSVNKLIAYKARTSDGDIRNLKGFYFDVQTWTIRYLIVETGSLLFPRHSLVSTQSLLTVDWENRFFLIDILLDNMDNGPAVDWEKPISQKQVMEWKEHYSQFCFQAGEGINTDTLLYSTIIKDYHVNARDVKVGKPDDFLVDDTNWKVTAIVLDAFAHPPAKVVLIPPSWVKQINPETDTITIDVPEEKIKNLPEYFAYLVTNETYEV